MSTWRKIGLGIVFVWFFGGGIGHFVADDFFAKIVPPYIPMDAYWVVYISGVFELLGAFGVLLARTRQLAGLCLIALTLAVSLANIHMWLNPELFPDVPSWALSLRLVIQVLFIACIWFSTQPPRKYAA